MTDITSKVARGALIAGVVALAVICLLATLLAYGVTTG